MTAVMLRPLAVSGSRNSDGTPNASGLVYLYSPGTTSLMTGYMDEALSQAWPVTNGAIVLDAGGRAVIWVSGQVDVIIQGPTGNVVSTLLGFADTPANTVTVQNAGYTGTITDPVTGNQTQGVGGVTNLDKVLSNLAASVGGPDGQYQESAGATARSPQKVIREIHVTPQDFGAIGNGSADDTAATLSAVAELGRLGSGVLYFPPGTYALSANLQVGLNSANAAGISIEGAGSGSSILKWTVAAGLLLYTTRARVTGLSLTTTVGSDVTATYLAIENAINVIVEDVVTDAKCRVACSVRGASEVVLRANKFAAADADALAIGLHISSSAGVRAIGNSIIGGSSGLGLYVDGPSTTRGILIDGNTFSNCGLAGAAFQGDLISTVPDGVSLVNNPSLSQLSVPIMPLGTTYLGNGVIYPTNLVQQGNGIEGLTANVTSGGTVTPLYSKGRQFRFVGTTTGSAYIVNAPDVLATTVPRDTVITLTFVNAAGGAVTGWTLNAIYKTTASIPVTDGHTIQVQFLADPNGSGFGGNWREIARSDTTT